jgi:hypothetical protein
MVLLNASLALALFSLFTCGNAIKLENESVFTKSDTAITAKFSRMTYESNRPNSIAFTYNGTCDNWVRVQTILDKSTSTQLDAWKKDSNLIIAFRGTDPSDLNNIQTDLTTPLVPCQLGNKACGNVHQGFQNSYLRIQPALQRLVDQQIGTSPNIYLTGHSLGKLSHTYI